MKFAFAIWYKLQLRNQMSESHRAAELGVLVLILSKETLVMSELLRWHESKSLGMIWFNLSGMKWPFIQLC